MKEIMNNKPSVFIGSSTENLEIAYAIQKQLEYTSEPTVWTQGFFKLSRYALDDLIENLKIFDFAVFVFTPNDEIKISNEERKFTIRDNIIFEFGLAIGILGKERVFSVIPKDFKQYRIPTDLIGITFSTYDPHRNDNNIQAALGPSIFEIQKQIDNIKIKERKKIPKYIKKEFEISNNDNREEKVISIEHPYDYEPNVSLIDNNGNVYLADIKHYTHLVEVRISTISLKGKIIIYE